MLKNERNMILDTIALPEGNLVKLQPYQERLLADLNNLNPHVFRPPYRRSGTSTLLASYILTHMVRDMSEDDTHPKRVLIVSENINRATYVKDYILDVASITPLTSSNQMMTAIIENIRVETISAFERSCYGKYSLVFFEGMRQGDMNAVQLAMKHVSMANQNVKCIIELSS